MAIASLVENYVHFGDMLDSIAVINPRYVEFLSENVMLVPMKWLFLNLFQPITDLDEFMKQLDSTLKPYLQMEQLEGNFAVISVKDIECSISGIEVKREVLYKAFDSVLYLLHKKQAISIFYQRIGEDF